MDVKTYKQNLKNQIEEAHAKAEADPGHHLEAALDPGFGSAKDRVAAILQSGPADDDMSAYVERLLATVEDNKEAVSVRLAAMKALKAARFQGPQFEPYLDDYNTTLRKVSDDRSANVRDSAIGALAKAKDSYIIDKLLKGLEKKIDPLVPEDKAIRYLSYDEHSGAVNVVRDMFDALGDRAKESAVRILASDTKSEGILAKVMADKTEKSTLRCLSAAGLKNLNPTSFKDVAEKILSNDTEFDEIKALCVSALANNIRGGGDLIDDGVIQKVKDIRSKSRNLRSAVRRFVDRL